MSNHKMQFPSHISKSWLSVCIFIFLLTVCVGLAIHVTSEEDAICSDSDHSEVPIVSNENVSEKSGSDIEYAKNYVPTEEDVLAARQQATEGMSQQQIENLTEVVKTANLWLEHTARRFWAGYRAVPMDCSTRNVRSPVPKRSQPSTGCSDGMNL